MIRKFLAAAISLSLIISLAACTADNTDVHDTTVQTGETETAETIIDETTDCEETEAQTEEKTEETTSAEKTGNSRKTSGAEADGFTLTSDCFEIQSVNCSYSIGEIYLIKAIYEVISLNGEAEAKYSELASTLAKVNELSEQAAKEMVDSFKEQADEDYAANPERFEQNMYYSYEYRINPVSIRDGFVGFSGETYSYMGGVHPNITCNAWTFDIETGMTASVNDIIRDTDALVTVLADRLEEYYGDGLMYEKEDLCRYLSCGISGDMFDGYEVKLPWQITENGIEFLFGDYAVAAYASGRYYPVISSDDCPELFY